MSKLRCSCGYVIADQTDDLPYKAGLVPDSDAGEFLEAIAAGAAGLADSVANGTLEQWVSTALAVAIRVSLVWRTCFLTLSQGKP